MCGRALRCKGKLVEHARLVQSCVRPVIAVLMTAGLDEVCDRIPINFSHSNALGPPGLSRSPVRPVRHHVSAPLHPVVTLRSGDLSRRPGPPYVSPRTITAQAIRAVLLASATATTRALALEQPAAQTLPGLSCRANRKTAVAPITSRRRMYPSPCLLIPPSRSLPPLLCDFGVSPSQAANWRPDRNKIGSGTLAAIALAVIGPMPGIVAQPPARLAGPMPLEDFRLDLLDLLFDVFDLADQAPAGRIVASTGRPPAPRGTLDRRFHPADTLAATMPYSARWPAAR